MLIDKIEADEHIDSKEDCYEQWRCPMEASIFRLYLSEFLSESGI